MATLPLHTMLVDGVNGAGAVAAASTSGALPTAEPTAAGAPADHMFFARYTNSSVRSERDAVLWRELAAAESCYTLILLFVFVAIPQPCREASKPLSKTA